MNVLCVAAHPDDEVLGCGATLAKHADNGDDVHVFILVERGLAAATTQAAKTLGFRFGSHVGFTDQQLDMEPLTSLVTLIERQPAPDVVYTHNPDDLNLDHALTAKAVLTAFRPCVSKATILAFETISSTEWSPSVFEPNWFETFDGENWTYLQRKIDALGCYPSELRDQPHPRNAEGVMVQARFRGAQCGAAHAEAFRLIRRIA